MNKKANLCAVGLSLVLIATLVGPRAQASVVPPPALHQTNPTDAADA